MNEAQGRQAGFEEIFEHARRTTNMQESAGSSVPWLFGQLLDPREVGFVEFFAQTDADSRGRKSGTGVAVLRAVTLVRVDFSGVRDDYSQVHGSADVTISRLDGVVRVSWHIPILYAEAIRATVEQDAFKVNFAGAEPLALPLTRRMLDGVAFCRRLCAAFDIELSGGPGIAL